MSPLLTILAPELTLVIAGAVILLTGLSKSPGARRLAAPLAVIAVLLAAVIIATANQTSESISGLRVTGLSYYIRLVTLGVGVLVLLAHWPLGLAAAGSERSDLFAMILFSLSGILLTSVADELVLLFLAIELVSVPTYVLVSIGRSDIRAQEAGLKYFFLGAMSAALLVYGFSFLYGASGTTLLSEMHLAPTGGFATIGLLLAFAGLSYKVAAVPFHMYAADVYQGAASPVTGLLGFFPKVAGFVAIIKLLTLTQPTALASGSSWMLPSSGFAFLWVVAAVTMTVGNVLGLMQHNVKRMLAYSSIAHSGYMLVGLLVGPDASRGPFPDGVSAAMFYIAAYGVMNLGAFAVLSMIEAHGRGAEELEHLVGLGKRQPVLALALAICVFSLMGMPPTAGFFAKIYIIASALSAAEGPHGVALRWLAVIAVINSAIGAGYYLRIVATCYLRDEESPATIIPNSGALRVGVLLCCLFVLVVGLWPQGLLNLARGSTLNLQPPGAVVVEQVVPPVATLSAAGK